jgi:isopentenyldiphosphate isomerase
MAYPPVIIVDKDDQEIGLAMVAEVWEKGLRHRIVRIMVEDGQGRILLQRRSANMKLFPGYWDHSAGGHVDEGMTYQIAAVQEVTEELGIVRPKLEEVGYYYSEHRAGGRKLNNFSKVYHVRLAKPIIMYEPEEVSEVRWFTRNELEELIRINPRECTPGLRDVVERYYCKEKAYDKADSNR